MRTIFLFAIALTCASGFAAAAQDAAKPAAMAREHTPPHAKVSITSPKDGATVGQDVTVKFGAEGVAVVPLTEVKPASGHHHLLIDVKELPPLDAPIPNDATHKHYGKGQTEDTIHLEPGTHTLQLDFGDSKHMQFDPPLVSKKITIHVK
jgi:hypothetical protein